MTVIPIPSFARLEISIASKNDLLVAAVEMKNLASELEFIAGTSDSEDDATILAHHRIRATSKKLRKQ